MAEDARVPQSDDERQQPEAYEPPEAEELATTQPVETAAAISQL
jgi:hypothetical protein